MPEFSVVTIVKGRRKQLSNLLESIKLSTIQPKDVQVVCMDAASNIELPDGLNVVVHELDSGSALPLAAARNKGIGLAQTDTIVFVDVDCTVSPTLFDHLLVTLGPRRIVTAFPLYLPFVPESGRYDMSISKAASHPRRRDLPVGVPVDHLQFWSLIFAVTRPTFESVGGFDEAFTGYGAEDTDFAMPFHQAGVGQFFVCDYVLHQYHDKYDPPLNHFDAIITNALRYKGKWGTLPMQGWLNAFEQRGLVHIENGSVSIVRHPTDAEITSCISRNPY